MLETGLFQPDVFATSAATDIENGRFHFILLSLYCLLPEHLRYGAPIVDAADGSGEEFGDGEDGHVGEALAFGLGDGVGDDDLFNVGVAEAFQGRAGEDAVGDAAVDIARAALLDDTHRLRDGACGVDLLVDDEGMTALDAADDVLGLGQTAVAQAKLLDDGERGVEPICQLARLLGEAFVSGDNREIVYLLLDKVARLENLRGQFIDGDVEKTLDLPGVHVHCQHAVRARDGDAIGDQAGGDGNARLIFLIGASIGIVRNHSGDAVGGGTFESVDHDK